MCHYRSIHLIDRCDWFRQQNPVGFATGQSARLLIGQPEFDAELDTASQTILGAASGLAFANDTLFVVDANLVGRRPGE